MFADYIESLHKDSYSINCAEHIDTLTFNRIVDFEQLTGFQKNIILKVHQRLTDFEKDNEELLYNSMLASYSLKGVSMSFDKQNSGVSFICGIAIPDDLYSMLCKTGLCYPAL